MEERRKYPRTEISFPLECKMLPDAGYFYTVSKNLSLAGIKIISDQFIPKDSIVRLHVNFIDMVIDIKARVTWCSKQRTSDRYTVGLEFVEKTDAHELNIAHFLRNINS